MSRFVSRPASQLLKRPDWVTALEAYLDAAKHHEFAYGTHDCCCFVANAVHAMTGCDLMARFRGRYQSVEQIQEVIAQEQASCLTALMRRELMAQGWSVVPLTMAQRGDIALMSMGALGIISLDGRHVIGVHPEQGLSHMPLKDAVRIWSVR